MDRSITVLFPGLAILLSSFSYLFMRKARSYPVISSAVIFIALMVSLIGVSGFQSDAIVLFQHHWLSLGGDSFLNFGLLSDRLSGFMCSLVLFISFLVHLFSIEYMKDDPEKNRFFSLLGFFTFSMLGLLLAESFLFLFVFWELVGFSSYLLIGFWWKKPQAVRAAKKAFLLNRIGDIGLLIALMMLWTNYGSFSIPEIQLEHQGQLSGDTTFIGICLLIAAIGKSAQFPLFNWLPDAMEGPTPVSALIHAATMVAAGVYLLIRSDFLFSFDALTITAVIGSVTALLGGISALSKYDIKKVLAYSTISQLGYMIMGIGTGASDASAFHLITHAFFKAGLFLGAGAIIHLLHEGQKASENHFDAQDIRNMGSLRPVDKVLFISFLVCSAGLAGLPLFSGFLSKDAILSASLLSSEMNGGVYYIVSACGFITAVLTPVYTGRLVWMVFFARPSKNLNSVKNFLQPNKVTIQVPLIFLAILSVGLVFSINPFDYDSSFVAGWIGLDLGSSGKWHTVASVSSVILVSFGLMVVFMIYKMNANGIKEKLKATGFYALSRNAFFLDTLTHHFISPALLIVSEKTGSLDRKVIDRTVEYITIAQVITAHIIAQFDYWIIDGFIRFLAYLSRVTGKFFSGFQSGNIQKHIIWLMFFTLLVMLILLF